MGVKVGHVTRIEGADVRTGFTSILAHGGDIYKEPVPAGYAVANDFGKFAGSAQVQELGEIETPILLTNPLAVPVASHAIIEWALSYPGNGDVATVNPIVGETNDRDLNNIRSRSLTMTDGLAAITSAASGPVAQGSVRAGTGTKAFGWKAGIGSSSRVLPSSFGGWTVGVLVQSNFGGNFIGDGLPLGRVFGRYLLKAEMDAQKPDESIIIIIATDAPLSDRNLTRLARRSFAGMARTGASFSNGSGDFALAFSTAPSVRRKKREPQVVGQVSDLANDQMTPLFVAVSEATEEAILNSLFKATPITRDPIGENPGSTADVIDTEKVAELIKQRQ